MHVETVSDAVVDTLYSGYGRTIFLPGIFRFFAGVVSCLHSLIQEVVYLTVKAGCT